jgi:predicted Rossmann-fold nucleotide-binding protein
VYLDVYRARARAAGVAATPAGFQRWLQRHLEVSGTRELAARVGRSFARRGGGGGGPVMAPSREAA